MKFCLTRSLPLGHVLKTKSLLDEILLDCFTALRTFLKTDSLLDEILLKPNSFKYPWQCAMLIFPCVFAISKQMWGMWEKNFWWSCSTFPLVGIPLYFWSESVSWVTAVLIDRQLCDTYPSLLYVPSIATTPVLVGSSKFRSRGRLPALSYLHRENQVSD